MARSGAAAREGAAVPRAFALRPGAAAVPLGHRTHDEQAEPGAFDARRQRPGHAVEAPENALQLRLVGMPGPDRARAPRRAAVVAARRPRSRAPSRPSTSRRCRSGWRRPPAFRPGRPERSIGRRAGLIAQARPRARWCERAHASRHSSHELARSRRARFGVRLRAHAAGAQDLLDGGQQAVAVLQHDAVELLRACASSTARVCRVSRYRRMDATGVFNSCVTALMKASCCSLRRISRTRKMVFRTMPAMISSTDRMPRSSRMPVPPVQQDPTDVEDEDDADRPTPKAMKKAIDFRRPADDHPSRL